MKRVTDRLLRWLTGRIASGGAAILIYHRVLPREDIINPDLTVDLFEAHMRGIREHFTPVTLSEAIERLDSRSLAPRTVCVTFDDGYVNNVEVALPILERYGIPAAFFITTGFLEGGLMWNDAIAEAIRAMSSTKLDMRRWGLGILALDTFESKGDVVRKLLAHLKYASAAERESSGRYLANVAAAALPDNLMMRPEHVRTLRRSGMEIGAHSVTHPILANLSNNDARREIVESGTRLSEILREPIRLFAYPNGKPGTDYVSRHAEMVRSAGYRAALATSAGVATHRSDRFQLPRISPWGPSPRGFSLRLMQSFYRARSGQT